MYRLFQSAVPALNVHQHHGLRIAVVVIVLIAIALLFAWSRSRRNRAGTFADDWPPTKYDGNGPSRGSQ